MTSNLPQPASGAFQRLLIADVAERLQCTVGAVRKMIERGELSTTVVGIRRPLHTFDLDEVQNLAFARAKRRGHSMRSLLARAADTPSSK